MAYPYGIAAKVSQFPYRFAWHESMFFRYGALSCVIFIYPLYFWIDSKLLSAENKKTWKEKRQRDDEHHRHLMEKKWEIRT